jgi:hypothetical protein
LELDKTVGKVGYTVAEAGCIVVPVLEVDSMVAVEEIHVTSIVVVVVVVVVAGMAERTLQEASMPAVVGSTLEWHLERLEAGNKKHSGFVLAVAIVKERKGGMLLEESKSI